MKPATKHRLLIQIDAIMDTRLACLEKADISWAKAAYEGNYYKRITNNFSYISPIINNEKYKEIWNSRDVEILKKSKPTVLLKRLMDNQIETVHLHEDQPDFLELEVTLNVYPYKLNSEEKEEFKKILSSYLHTERVRVSYIPYTNMNPHWVKTNFDQMILHDVQDWLGPHVEYIKDNRPKSVIITFPLILLDEVDPNGKNHKHILDNLRLIFMDIFQADIIPLGDVSTLSVPEYVEEKTNE